MRLFINYKRNVNPDGPFAEFLEQQLLASSHEVFRDATGIFSGTQWAQQIQREIEACDAVISLVSNASLQSDWVLNEIDFARRRNKLIIPVLLEKLEESLEFQEFIPRFLRIQHTTYSGNDRETVREIIDRLDRGPAILSDEEWKQVEYEVNDDSVNPGWKEFVEDNRALTDEGVLRIGLDEAVRLATRRSIFCQRAARLLSGDHADKEPRRGGRIDRQVLEAYRQGLYTQVAIGEFGASGFCRAREGAASVPEGGIGGFFGVLRDILRLRCLEEGLEELASFEDMVSAFVEAGRAAPIEVELLRQFMDQRRIEALQVHRELEDALEDFKTYTLGLPGEVPVDVDATPLREFELGQPEIGELSARLGQLRRRACELRGDAGNAPPGLQEDLRIVRDEIAGQFSKVQAALRELDAVSPRREADMDAASLQQFRTRRERLQSEADRAEKEFRQSPQPAQSPAEDLLAEVRDRLAKLGIEKPASFLKESVARRSRGGEWVFEEMNSLALALEELAFLRLRIRLESLVFEQLELPYEQAETIALACRPDARLIQTNAAVRRAVRRSVRRALRQARYVQERLESRRRTTAIAAVRLDMARWSLREPPRPGRESDFLGGPLQTYSKAADLRSAIADFHQAKFDFMDTVLEHHAARLRLMRELGVMDLDDDGLLVEPALHRAVEQAEGRSDRSAPPAGP